MIRAHHLHYASLLEDLRMTIIFVQNTINPALDSFSPEERDSSVTVMKRECDNLLDEVNRLEREREMQERRLRNVMHLVCGGHLKYFHVQNLLKGNFFRFLAPWIS